MSDFKPSIATYNDLQIKKHTDTISAALAHLHESVEKAVQAHLTVGASSKECKSRESIAMKAAVKVAAAWCAHYKFVSLRPEMSQECELAHYIGMPDSQVYTGQKTEVIKRVFMKHLIGMEKDDQHKKLKLKECKDRLYLITGEINTWCRCLIEDSVENRKHDAERANKKMKL